MICRLYSSRDGLVTTEMSLSGLQSFALTGADSANKRSVADEGDSVKDCHAAVSEGDEGNRVMRPHISSTSALSDDSRRKNNMSSCSDDEVADGAVVDKVGDDTIDVISTSMTLVDWQSLAGRGSDDRFD